MVDSVNVAGLRIAFRRFGSGPCLLLLHGAVSDSRVWRRELERMSDSFTVVAWDAPGCGASSDPPEQFRMPDYAECLGEFIGVLGLGQVNVLGHSWGSTLALELYRQRPSVVSALVLVGAYAGWAGSLPPAEVDERLRTALRIADVIPDEFRPDSFAGLFSDVMPADRAEELRAVMSEIRPSGTRTMAYALAEADLRDVLPRIEVPTLVLAGGADERSPLTVAGALHAAIRGSTLTVIPGAGHECYLEFAEDFEAIVRDFLLESRCGPFDAET